MAGDPKSGLFVIGQGLSRLPRMQLVYTTRALIRPADIRKLVSVLAATIRRRQSLRPPALQDSICESRSTRLGLAMLTYQLVAHR